MMIYKAKHHFFLYPFFQLYSVWKIQNNFHRVHINSNFSDKGLPVLIVSNHISWWDGFWVVYLNRKMFRRKYFFFMMLEEQLKERIFLNKAGGYSVNKRSRSIIETIDYTVRLLDDNRNLVLMFPQGEINSLYNTRIHFEKGLEHILRKKHSPIHLVFLVNLIDFFSNQKPSLFMYLKEYQGKETDTQSIESEYNRFYNEALEKNIKKAKEG